MKRFPSSSSFVRVIIAQPTAIVRNLLSIQFSSWILTLTITIYSCDFRHIAAREDRYECVQWVPLSFLWLPNPKDSPPGQISDLNGWYNTASVSHRSWVRMTFKPEFLYNCDDQSCLLIPLRSSNKWHFIYSNVQIPQPIRLYYSQTSRKWPPKMSRLGGHIWELRPKLFLISIW